MDNIKDENLKRLGKYIAQEFINLARETTKTDWVETNVRDYSIGELARCVTLQNLYLRKMCYNESKNNGVARCIKFTTRHRFNKFRR